MSETLTPGHQIVENMLTAIRTRDLAGILNTYEESDDLYVFLEGPRWSSRTYTNVSAGWTAWYGADLEIYDHEWVEGPVEITVKESSIFTRSRRPKKRFLSFVARGYFA
jgi:hypothetical protein